MNSSALRSLTRVSAVIVTGALVASSATVSASAVTMTAQAPQLSVGGGLTDSGGACSPSDSSPASPAPATLTPGAAATTQSFPERGTVADTSVSGDVSSVAVSNTVTARYTQTGGYPTALAATFHGQGSVSPAAAHTPSGCAAGGNSNFQIQGAIDLPRPGLVTMTAHAEGAGSSFAFLDSPSSNNDAVIAAVAGVPGSKATASAFLPAGVYPVWIQGGTNLNNSTTASSVTSSGGATIAFTPGGSRLSGPSGTAGHYVTLGSARNCTAHTLTSRVTTNATDASRIGSIDEYGNGTRLLGMTHPGAGRNLTVTLPDDKTESIRLLVVLRNGHSYPLSASYLRCA